MIVYHGSEYIIKKPQSRLGRKNNDYGQGFYCTISENMAKEWAVSHGKNGYVNSYELNEAGLEILDLLNGEYNILNWLAILLQNRTFSLSNVVAKGAKEYILEHFLVQYGKADLIIGYRADDSYFTYASDFLNNTLPLSRLEKAMKLGDLGEQIFLGSEKAFDKLCFLNSEPVAASDYYNLWLRRDSEARMAYRNMKYEMNNEIFVMDLIREEWGSNDERLQRIVRG